MTLYISPYRRMANLRRSMNRMFDDTFAETASQEREMVLAVDVQGTDEDYTISALIPGIEADELELEILNNTVTIRGEFPSCKSEDAKYLLCELPAGNFSRSISLPTAVDAAKAEAAVKSGVLTLHIPKVEAHRPKAIQVKTV